MRGGKCITRGSANLPPSRDGSGAFCVRAPLTFDHRVADGADGARFARRSVRLLEHPDELLLEL